MIPVCFSAQREGLLSEATPDEVGVCRQLFVSKNLLIHALDKSLLNAYLTVLAIVEVHNL